jgi:di/tricarboxylate transporter
MALVAAFYLITALLTETMSNNATVALLAPIAIVAAESVGMDPRGLLFAVTFAASASFMTPVGYQTNTLIYGPGGYRFGDYVRVGTPLNLIFWIIATIMIPRLWPA